MNPVTRLLEEKPVRKTITLVVSDQAAEELLPLLQALKTMGSQGSSRSITIEDWDGRYGFDGDGNAKIDSIAVDGVEHQPKDYDAVVDGKEQKPRASKRKPKAHREVDHGDEPIDSIGQTDET